MQPTEGQKAASRIKAARGMINQGMSAKEARQELRRPIEDLQKDGVVVTNLPTPKKGGNVITPESLTPTPQVQVTPPVVPTAAPALQADLEVQTDEFTKAQTAAREAAQKTSTTALQDYLDTIKGMATPSQLEAQQMEATGANLARTDLNDINDQIRREQLANRRVAERILAEGGQSKAQAQAQINNLNRESLQKQADLSVIQMAAQGRYDSAKEIADRAVKARLEQQTLLTEAARFNYTENKEIFTRAEQREFETLLGNRERALKAEEDKLKTIQQFALTALQAGASVAETQRIMNATSLDEAIGIGGAYLRPKPAAVSIKAPDLQNFGTSDNPNWKQFNPSTGQWEDVKGVTESGGQPFIKVTNKEIQDLNDTAIAKNSFNSIVDQFQNSIKGKGTKVLFGKAAGERDSLKTSLLLAMKNMEKTGALDAGTIDVLSGTIPGNTFFATEAGQIAALEELRSVVTSKADEKINSYRGTTAELDPRTTRLFPQAQLPAEDIGEIDSILGTQSQTTAAFNPASFY